MQQVAYHHSSLKAAMRFHTNQLCLSLFCLATFVLLTPPAWGQSSPLPEPAIPGLRYYYPPEKIEARTIKADVCIYGGTSAGIVAAIQADRMGKSVVLLEFGKHLGGLSSGGLSHTDGGDKSVCGGIAREFYNIIGQASFRPSEAEAAYESLLEPTNVQVFKLAHLNEVTKQGSRIVSLTMEDGLTVEAKQFLDCTYEGDLLARAGVSWHAGREANSVYNETYNGIRTPGKGGHNWPKDVDPYVIQGKPESGLLPRLTENPGIPGEGDQTIQAFCFRMWLTKKDPLPFPKPAVYDETEYELLARLFEAEANPKMGWSLDTNNHHLFNGAYFIDYVGGNYDWPTASWKEREQIFQDHANYQIGVMHFLTNSPRIPASWQQKMAQWGLPRDEYQQTGGWTHQLYIREGRRMLSDYVMTEHNCDGSVVPEDSVGLASYNMDSHHCQMTVVDGAVRNEGNVEIRVEPYPIAYRALVPKRSECTNLLVPVALSSSHIAFGSIRMEPVFMLLGQSAATAASMAIDHSQDVQDVDYPTLRKQLLKDGQILEYTGPPRHQSNKNVIRKSSLKGLALDNNQATLTGPWKENNVTSPRVGSTYLHDDNKAKGECKAIYHFENVPEGFYNIQVSYPPNGNRATNVPVLITTAGKENRFKLNQKKTPTAGGFQSLILAQLKGSVTVEISNEGTNGYVIADCVQLLPTKPLPLQMKQRTENKVSQTANPNAPNILLLFADDLGYETLGCYGSLDYQTPHLDDLAHQGMRFTRAYTSPVCTPSRMSLYTGLYASSHRYNSVLPVHVGTRKAVNFRNQFSTYAQQLQQAGYLTSVTGKWQLAALEHHPNHIREAGFDSWCIWQIWKQGAKTTRYWNPCFNHDGAIRTDIKDRFGPDVLAEYVIEQMKQAKAQGRPFCIHHNMLLPHVPVVKTPTDVQQNRQASLASMINYTDLLCGRILKAVDELELAENTIVIFMGDNGTDLEQPRSTKAGQVTGGKRRLNDGGCHIPLIVRWKGKIEAGTVADDLIDMADWYPTLCELTGTPIPADVPLNGISFAKRLTEGEPSPRTYTTAGYSKEISLFDGQYRLLKNRREIIDSKQLPQETVHPISTYEHLKPVQKLDELMLQLSP